jgi:hypothetical protein
MIAKIGHGSNIYGALVYNHNKVLQNTGQILHLHNMLETPDGKYTTTQLLSSFLPHLAANKKTEKIAIHISLNPDPNDHVSDEDFIKIADEYMTKMGYGDQPYVVFKHQDIDRTHIHIVSTSVDKNGVKISDSFEKKRSMDICRELEKTCGLTPANEKTSADEHLSFMPIDYALGNIKSQMASVVRYLPRYYQFQNLGGYNALLSLFNITAEYIKKDINGEIKEGLVYIALDNNGNKVSPPFKASLFGKQAGLSALRSQFENSKKVSPEIKAKTSQLIVQAIQVTATEKEFKNFLIQHGMNTVIRRNDQGRLYGITFVDHQTGNVFNGSHLGKEFSANVFQELFSNNGLKLTENNRAQSVPHNPTISAKETTTSDNLHPFFDFMINLSDINGFGLLESLLMGNFSEDPEEQIFEFSMKKKRRKRKNNNNS